MAPPTKHSKPVYKTASPFTETKWPQTSHDDQATILDLVCTLIAPLGDHRKTHIIPSRGKKRKRKRKSQDEPTAPDTEARPPPPRPEIAKHLLIGINSVTRHLELRAARHSASVMPIAACKTETPSEQHSPGTLSMVIITHPKPSTSPAHAHLPTLVHLSTLKPSAPTQPQDKTTRLIPLATSTDARLASALHIPRVGALAIFADAPGAKPLEDFVRERVGVTECPWIDEAMRAQWKGTNLTTEHTAGKTQAKPKGKEIDAS
ncbi:hypothetical protein BDU57DRAFT_555251 [Ampelomyces quisqualis]|uniref:RNase P subunit Pop3-domain-containing protein n=1 Tax=Ampelomyces quisqualis TaxID=50730 RepID=A0A6A5QRC4_AMPQU|nr:hypothetical protein BDU57DRAFT_555251 [Ampelomyces quisqualis]